MSDERPSDEEPHATAYGRRVGERLRGIRRQKRLSLQDVEANSTQEFKASVLGAYERGERAISVPRLQRLARFYNVPVDQLLPPDEGPDFDDEPGHRPHRSTGRAGARQACDRPHSARRDQRPDADMLARYLSMIQVQRQDFNGRVLTVRADDLRAIACILDVEADQAARRLEDLGLRLPSALIMGSDMPPFGVYVHVPFCAKRCDYCAFATWTDRMHLVDAYLDACVAEIGRAVDAGLPAATSVFFGGGTPSLVPADGADARARPHPAARPAPR